MNKRPFHIWLIIVLSAMATGRLLSGIVSTAIFYGHYSPSLMMTYGPELLEACVYTTAGVGLFLRKPWVRWLFLLVVVFASFDFLASVPTLGELDALDITDAAEIAELRYKLTVGLKTLAFLTVAILACGAVFRYLGRKGSARPDSHKEKQPGGY
jgi:hypothetical protein